MKQIILLSAILLVLADKIYSQDHYRIPKTENELHTYFGVVYKDPLRWVDTIRKPLAEILDKQPAKYTNTSLTEMRDRYKLIAEVKIPFKLKEVNCSIPIIRTKEKFLDLKLGLLYI